MRVGAKRASTLIFLLREGKKVAEIHTLHQNLVMSDSEFDQECEKLHRTYGDDPVARSEQAWAKLYTRSGWTQQKLAEKVGVQRPRVAQLLLFGRFLNFVNFVTTGNKVKKMLDALTERSFRAYWTKADKAAEQDRFSAVLQALIYAAEHPTPKPTRAAKPKTDPKPGSGRRGDSTPALDKAREAVRPFILARKPIDEDKLANDIGVSHTLVDTAIQVEINQRNLLEELGIDPAKLSKTGKVKFDARMRAEKKLLAQQAEVEFQKRIAQHIKFLKAEMLPNWEKDARAARVNREYYEKLVNSHKPPLTYDEFMLLHLCVRGDASEEKRHQAGVVLNSKREILIGKKPE